MSLLIDERVVGGRPARPVPVDRDLPASFLKRVLLALLPQT